MSLYNRILIWFFLIIGLAAYNVWTTIGEKFFYIGTSINLALAAMFMLNNSKGFTKRIALVVVATTFSTFIDEIFFNPTVFCYNDYILLPVAFLITYIPCINVRYKR